MPKSLVRPWHLHAPRGTARLRAIAIALIVPLLALAVAAPAARAASIWTDSNGDGLPDGPGGVAAAPGEVVTVGIWIDSGAFAWTNFLAYVEWDPVCLTYLTGTYIVDGGTNFPIDTFSHPSGVGFGGFNFVPRQGLDLLARVSLRLDTAFTCCVLPIIDPENPYQVFSQLGQGDAYALFTEMTGSCWISTASPEACCFVDGTCADLTPTDCAAQGGVRAGAGTACATTNCTPMMEACCFPDGSCVVAFLGDCPAGAAPQGAGSDCSVPCPSTVGACCYLDGSCAETLSRIACESAGGAYQGDGSVCADVVCTPRGACCLPTGECTNGLSADECAAAGGDFRGGGSVCSGVTCVPPPQACCFVNGSCADLTVAECAYEGGTPSGAGTACATVVCTPVTEACCFPDGSCVVAILYECPVGSVPRGEGSNCDTPCPILLGACCYLDGSCASPIARTECEAVGGAYQGDATTCAQVTCTPRGACCLPSGSCAGGLTPEQCAAAGGDYRGDATACADVTCPQPTGACCLLDGSCESLTLAECAAAGGQYEGNGTACGVVICTPRGACCFPNGTCFSRAEESCVALGGAYQGDGTRCADVSCPPPSGCGEPSEWYASNVFGGYPGELSSRPVDVIREKNARLSGNAWNPPAVLVGGETIGSAVPISVPGASSGNTCDNADDYDEVCPFSGSTSGDEVYMVTGVDGQVTFDLCNSGYDTKIYVYAGSAGNLIACNDDACNDPSGNPFRSIVTCVNLISVCTYYVVIDGYFGDCGEYNFSAYFSAGCPAVCDPEGCPPGAVAEGEPACGPNYVDSWNGGCNSSPPVFTALGNAGCTTVCGEGGNYNLNGLSYRDTDWYSVNLPVACNVTATLCASFDSQLAVLDGNAGCAGFTIVCGSVFGTPGATISCGPTPLSGAIWVFAATSAFSGVPCGSPYVLSVTTGACCPTNATESKTWGQIKSMYR